LRNSVTWIFSGIGVFALGLVGGAVKWLWNRRQRGAAPFIPDNVPVSAPAESAPAESTPVTKPNPDDMYEHVTSLPPYQQENAWDAYRGLEVRWLGLFEGIEDDEPYNEAHSHSPKKWIVTLKHYDPSIRYSSARIRCPGIDLDQFPQFKSTHGNELLIVRGKIAHAKRLYVLLYPAAFEFGGKRIG
jgi:hypothetical protein